MALAEQSFEVSRLAEGRIPSPLKEVYFVKDDDRVLFHSGLSELRSILRVAGRPLFSKKAGRGEDLL